MKVIKRDKTEEEFDFNKIEAAVDKAFAASREVIDDHSPFYKNLEEMFKGYDKMSVEEIQNSVENFLMRNGYYDTARLYILYRETHKHARFIRERLDYMEQYSDKSTNAASASETDSNANVTMKNVANLEGEVYKVYNRIIQRQRMKDELHKLFPEVSSQYEEDLNHHIIYTHDEASTPVLKQYCMAVSLYPLMLEGVGNIDGVTPGPPNDLQSFSGQITNLAFLLSSQCKGAVAFGEYFIALNYYVIKEYGNNWYEKLGCVTSTEHCLNKRTIGDNIRKAFKQFVYGVNQPAGNRSYQSPFTNISYYDSTYFNALFNNFYYPDGTKPEWKAIDTLQRMFLKWFNKERLKQILTFPVETFAMVYDPKTNDIIDQNYKDLCAEMYAEGHSFFTYISDSADSLASCCFTPETKILWKSSTLGVQCTTLKELEEMKWEPNKKNLRIFHNGFWVSGHPIKTSNVNFYRVETANHKVFYMTDNHINVTLKGEKKTKDLTINDYLMFNTNSLKAIPENDEHLTYEQGFAVGAFLGDGSFGSRYKDGIIYDINYSQNENKYKVCMENVTKANHQLGYEGNCTLNSTYNNVYPIRISSKGLVAFIQKWINWKEGTHSYNKELNLDCLLQSIEFRKGILDGWYNTDGGNSNRCYTTSENLKDCMEILITSLGMNSIIDISDKTDEKVIIRGQEYDRNYPLWCVRWYEPCNKANMKDVYKWKNNSQYFKIISIEHLGENPLDKYSYCIECSDKENPYFTLPSGLVTHNCRLRNELAENTFSPTSGLTGVMTGSCNVISLNINRIVQDCAEKYNYLMNLDKNKANNIVPITGNFYNRLKNYLINILERVYKYHIAFKTMLYDLEDKGMFAASNGGYIKISKLYSTVGINGLNEAARFLGLKVNNNPEYIKFLQLVLGTIKEQNKLHSIHDSKRPFLFNSEVVPAEGLGGKNYRWDKKDGYWVPDDENLYNSYFYDAHDNTSVLDKFILHGKQTYQYTDGGSAAHINLDAHLSKEQYTKLINFAIKNGTSYFTFNIPNTKCNKCGHIVKAPMNKCPICGSTDVTAYTRIIGYLRPVTAFGKDRQIEAKKRVYSNGKDEIN